MERTFWKSPRLLPATHALYPWILLFNVTLATVLAIISSVSTAVANSSIAGPLMIDETNSAWLSTGYLAAVGLCLPLSGWLGKRQGAKFTFFWGFAIFIFASLLAAFSPNFVFMLLMRLLEGAGAGLIFPISLTILQLSFPQKLMSVALSFYVGCGFGSGIILGLIAGGYIGQYMPWQWVYLINVFMGIPCLLFTAFFQQETESDKTGPSFDFIGFLLFGGFLASLLVILTNVKASWNTLGWDSKFAKGFISSIFICFILLLIRQARYKNPIIRLHLFKQKHFSVGCVILMMTGALLFGTVTTFPSLFEKQLGYQKFTVGLILSSFGFVMGPVGTFVGYLTKLINVRVLALIGLVMLLVSCFLQAEMITVQSENWQWILILMIRACGVAFTLGPVTSMSLEGIAPEDIPCGSMIVTFCRQMGGAMGGAILVMIGVYREEYHSQIYSSNVNIYSPAFHDYTKAFAERFKAILGFSHPESITLAKVMVIKNVKAQAQISAINDAFFILGWFVAFISLIVSILIIETLIKGRKQHVLRNN